MKISRTLVPLAAAALALGACEPAKYQLLPLEVAKYQLPKPLTTEVTARVEPEPPLPEVPVRVAGSYWLPVATEYDLPADFVRPVATVDGVMFHSLVWDAEPFDRLLAPIPARPGTWREFLEIYEVPPRGAGDTH